MELINNSTQKQGLAHLGQLFQLPTELRFIIWDFLFFESQENTPRTLFTILRCNQTLYNEIYYYVYQQVSHVLILRSSYGAAWAVNISFGKLRHEWVFEGKDTLQKYIEAFLRAKVSCPPIQLRVDIHPSSYKDRGRIICLWKKVNDLVKMLKESFDQHCDHIKPLVHVRLVGKWVKGGNFRRSIKDRRTENPIYLHGHQYRISHDDHDIVALPFLQLETTFHLPTQLRELLRQEPQEKPRSVLCEFLNEHREATGQSVSFDQEELHDAWIQIDMWMNFAITTCSGKMGRLLRQDRRDEERLRGFSYEMGTESEEIFLLTPKIKTTRQLAPKNRKQSPVLCQIL